MTPPLGPSGPVTAWRVLTTFATGPWAVATLVAEVAVLVWYGRQVLALRARGRRWPPGRSAAMAGGVLLLAVAWQSGVPVYAGQAFTVHIFQHLILMIACPILFALAAPVTLAMQTLSRPRKVKLLRVLRSRPLQVLTNPVVAGLGNYGIMYWFFLDRGIVVSMAHPAVMDLVNCGFLAFGCLLWWPIVSPDYIGRRRYPPIVRMVVAGVGMPFDSFLAVALLASGSIQSITPGMAYSIGSIHAGASVFWILVMLLTGVGACVPARELMNSERRRSVRADRLLATTGTVRAVSSRGWWGDDVHVGANGMMRVPWAPAETPPASGPGSDELPG